jgi:hypothetical protein
MGFKRGVDRRVNGASPIDPDHALLTRKKKKTEAESAKETAIIAVCFMPHLFFSIDSVACSVRRSCREKK